MSNSVKKMDEKGQEKILAKESPVNKEILMSVNSQEVNSLVSSPRTELVPRNRLRENIQNFESLSKTFQFTNVCELASFR